MAAVVLPVDPVAGVVTGDVVPAGARPVVRLSSVVVVNRVAVVIERLVDDDAAIAVVPVSPGAVPAPIVGAVAPVVSPQHAVMNVALRHVVDHAVNVVKRYPGIVVEDGIVVVVLGGVVVGVDLDPHLLGAGSARPSQQDHQTHRSEEEALHRLFSCRE
jgi:hypothetical protein